MACLGAMLCASSPCSWRPPFIRELRVLSRPGIHRTPAGSVQPGSFSAPEEDAGPAGICALTFGDQLTPISAASTGTVHAVQKPSDTQCTLPNSDHVIIQGADERRRVSARHQREERPAPPDGGAGDTRVQMLVKDGVPSPRLRSAEGWHTGEDI